MGIRTRAVAYLRVSTDKQADHGVGLDEQRAKVTAYAALYDLDIVEVIVDAGASAKTLEREGLARALGMLRSGAAVALLVAKLDRLTRSVRDLGELVEQYFAGGNLALLSVSEQIDTRSAGGRMMLNVLTVISQWEREVIGERTATAIRHKQSQGEYIGGAAPYGYRIARASLFLLENEGAPIRVEPEPAEQVVIAEARRLRTAGLPLRAIARELEAQGHLSRSGTTFQPEQVSRMVES